jgi:hypothetical protein
VISVADINTRLPVDVQQKPDAEGHVLVLGGVGSILITTTVSFATSDGDFACFVTCEIINGRRVRINAIREGIIDPLGIDLEAAKPVLNSRLCTITPKSG